MGSHTNIVADYFCISHIPAATISGSRLSDILVRMYEARPLTELSLGFLKRQNLPGLYRLACGEISHQAYIAEIDPACLNSHLAAKAALQAKIAEQQAVDLAQRANRAARHAAAKLAQEAERNLRRTREREATEAVLKRQRAFQAARKAQRERNCALAAAAYQARVTAPDYSAPTAHDIARYFHLDHLASAVCPPTSDILNALFRGSLLTDDQLSHLRHNAPDYLYQLGYGQLTLDAYLRAAKTAQAEAVARKAREEAAEAARIARENDPEYIAMMQTQALYSKYGLALTDKSLMPRMTKVLQEIDNGHRLRKDDLEWLVTGAKKHFTPPIREAYHRLEADFHAEQYRRTQDPWSAVNACGHYRKCDRSATALELIDTISRDRLKHPKVQSAVFTTRGGAMRDLGHPHEAIEMGESAHALMPNDYRPCTLLGAVHMELRNFAAGHDWYEKARKRGAPEQGIDSELRSIYRQLDSAGREAMKRFLLAEDSDKYHWLNETKPHEATKRLGSGKRTSPGKPSPRTKSAAPTKKPLKESV